jgi:hypothetical protein
MANMANNLEQGPWKKDYWWVSHFNFAGSVRENLNLPETVALHYSTLRFG